MAAAATPVSTAAATPAPTLTPTEAADAYVAASVGKAKSGALRLLILGIAAGIFIGLGAVAASTAAHAIPDVGLQRLVSGLVFPIGLVMVVLLGTELFTGNVLMVTAAIRREITWRALLRNWAIVIAGNLIGAVLLAACVAYFGQFDLAGGAVGTYAAKVATAKVALPWANAFVLGIFCNFLVCTAIYLALTARHTIGKIAALYLPVFGFVTAGFEHSVANMYYVPAGIFADWHFQLGRGLDFSQFFGNNLIPVILGNLVGGLAIGFIIYYAHATKRRVPSASSRPASTKPRRKS
jgi:formate/nitrite transporter